MTKYIYLILAFFVSLSIGAKDNPIALTIDGEPIYLSELQEAYSKDPEKKQKQFLESLIQHKILVNEAIKQGIDTTLIYKKDYSSTRIRLAANCTPQSDSKDRVLDMIYSRVKEDLELTQLFFPFDKKVLLPADTLKLYREVAKKRSDILKNGFDDKNITDQSQSPSIMMDWTRAEGYLGWITPFTLPMEVEDAVYNMASDTWSQPIRSKYGYHLIKLMNRRPAKGMVSIDQVMFNFPRVPPLQRDIDSVRVVADRIYKELQSGKRGFEELCELFNKSMGQEGKDCSLGTFKLNDPNLSPSLLSAAFKLDFLGEISKPILTDYGFHLVKLADTIPLPPKEELKKSLNSFLRFNERDKYRSDFWLKEKTDEYKLKKNEKLYTYMESLAEHSDPLDAEFIAQLKKYEDETILTINKKEHKLDDFIFILETNSTPSQNISIMPAQHEEGSELSSDKLEELFRGFCSKSLSVYEDENLETKFPEFGKLMKEYSEGVLIYELMKKDIWNKLKKEDEKEEKKLTDEWLKDLREKADIEINDAVIKQIQ